MARPATPIVLSRDERKQLEAMLRQPKAQARYALRARIVLCAAQGAASGEIARQLRIRPGSVSKWRTRFEREGLSGLHDGFRPGRPMKQDDEALLVNRIVRGDVGLFLEEIALSREFICAAVAAEEVADDRALGCELALVCLHAGDEGQFGVFSPRPWHQKWSGKGAGFVAALPYVCGTSTPARSSPCAMCVFAVAICFASKISP